MVRRAAVLALLLPATVAADEIVLRGGGRVSGIVVERDDASITVDVGPGRVTFPMRLVAEVQEGRSALAAYRQRAARLAPTDTEGWLELARWAGNGRLETQAREAFEHVLLLDPNHREARQALGQVRLGDRWVSRAESLRARGYVLHRGAWVTREERTAVLRERAEAAAAASARAEAGARVREAEARAQAAEAEARRAEAALDAAAAGSSGIPYGYVWLGSGGGGRRQGAPPRHRRGTYIAPRNSPTSCWAGCGERKAVVAPAIIGLRPPVPAPRRARSLGAATRSSAGIAGRSAGGASRKERR